MKVAQLSETYNLPLSSNKVYDFQVHMLVAVPNASYLKEQGFRMEHHILQLLQIEDGSTVALAW
jgi:hypothetical protein